MYDLFKVFFIYDISKFSYFLQKEFYSIDHKSASSARNDRLPQCLRQKSFWSD